MQNKKIEMPAVTGWIIMVYRGHDSSYDARLHTAPDSKDALVFDDLNDAKKAAIGVVFKSIIVEDSKQVADKVAQLQIQHKLDEALTYLQSAACEDLVWCEFVALRKSK